MAEREAAGRVRSIWMVSREYDGLAGAGGVKDVCRQLAEALAGEGGCEVTVVLPRYGFMDAEALGFTPLHLQTPGDDACPGGFADVFDVDMHYPDEERREMVSILERKMTGVRILLVEADRFAEKSGVYTYTAEDEARHAWQKQGSGHYDYFAMNILLQKAALDTMILLGERPHIIHCQDGHAATLAAMVRENPGYRPYFRHTGVVVTIHNAGAGYHQEVADLPFARAVTGLPESVIRAGRLGGAFDPFVAAAGHAVMNTVSENYARELQETAEDARTGWLGHRLLQRGVTLAGVTNGINPRDFDPASGKLGLAATFSPASGKLEGKLRCKEDMLRSCATLRSWDTVEQAGTLEEDAALPLFTFIGRLTAQKGVDILLQSLGLLLEDGEDGFQVLVLGSGDPALEEQLTAMTALPALEGRLCFLKGYDPALANRIYAAGDFFLIPSLYEPCGLTDYIAQLFGNLPVVHAVGGLVKVKDGETGFSYREHAPGALAETMQRALAVYRGEPARLRAMQRAAVELIEERYTWNRVMGSYFRLYDRALAMACGSRA